MIRLHFCGRLAVCFLLNRYRVEIKRLTTPVWECDLLYRMAEICREEIAAGMEKN